MSAQSNPPCSQCITQAHACVMLVKPEPRHVLLEEGESTLTSLNVTFFG
jgi:hypothetical protein